MRGNVLIDYLKATFILDEPEEKNFVPSECAFYIRLIELLCIDKSYIERTNGALFGYNFTVLVGEFIKIYISGPKNSSGYHTHLIEMTGQGCRDFEEHGGNWTELFKHLVGNDCNITRIDVANDLIDYKLFTIQDLLNKINKDEYKTPRFNKKRIIKSDKVNRTDTPGVSITFGSRKSEAVLQIYDKKAERKAKNYHVSCGSWIRFELRFYQSKAKIFMCHLLQNGEDKLPELFSSVLADSISFLEPTIQPQNTIYLVNLSKSVWKNCEWWDEHLGNIEKLKIQRQSNLESTVTKQIEWLDTSVSKVLMRVLASLGLVEYRKLQKTLLTKKLRELTTKDLSIVNHYNRLNNQNELTYDELINIIEESSTSIENGE